jgi:hypothetical protein
MTPSNHDTQAHDWMMTSFNLTEDKEKGIMIVAYELPMLHWLSCTLHADQGGSMRLLASVAPRCQYDPDHCYRRTEQCSGVCSSTGSRLPDLL